MALGLLIGLLGCMFLASANFRAPRTPDDPLPGGDYVVFHVAGRVILAGASHRLYDFTFIRQFQHDPSVIAYAWNVDAFVHYVYPPFFAWFCVPFACLPFSAGAVAWTLAMTGCLLIALAVLLRASPGGLAYFGWALLACLAYRPLLTSIYSGQNGTLSLLILTLVYVNLRAGRPGCAGLIFAGLAFKPHLTILIAVAMFCSRQWRFLAGAIAGGILLFAASLAVSPTATFDYVRLAPTMSRFIDMPGMPLERMTCWYGLWRLLLAGQPLHHAQIATVIASAVTLVVLVRVMGGSLNPSSKRFAGQYAALVLATTAVSPHLLDYDLTLLLLPIYLLATGDGQHALDPSALRPRLWALVLFVVASFSPAVAGLTGFQIIVPVVFVTLLAMARNFGRESSLQPARA